MLYSQTDLDTPEKVEFLYGEAFIYTHRSPDKSTVNEDAIAIIKDEYGNGVMAVADGLGGQPSGATASHIAINTLEQSLTRCDAFHMYRDCILDAFEKSNQKILGQGTGCATTLSIVELQDKEVRTYHVGDSKIVVCGQRGKIKLNTVSHSPVEYAVEAGILDENEAVHHEERHYVSNVVGMADMSITLGTPVKLSKYDTLLIASDGLYDNLYLDEIIEIIRKGPLKKQVEKLISIVKERMSGADNNMPAHPDDLSIILFRLK